MALVSLMAVAAAPTAWRPPALANPVATQPDGVVAARLNASLERLCKEPFTQRFILADVSFAEKRIFTEYSGDISGRMIGLVGTASAHARPQIWSMAEMLPELATYQKPDGHFGADQDLAHSVTGEKDMPILWGNGRLLIGLVETYNSTKDKRALEMAKKLGDYYVATDPLLDRAELVDKFGTYASGYATCYFSGIEGLVALSQAAKDRRYLDQAIRMAALMERTTQTKGELHSHGRLCALRGLLDLYEVTHEDSYLKRAAADAAIFRDTYLWPTGGLAESTIRSYPRDEGCSEADWLRLNLQLWRLTGNDSYLDMAEMVLLNELAVNQFPNGSFGHHVAARAEGGLMDGYYSIQKQGTQEAYWCCAEHGPRALLEVAPHIVTAVGSDIYVNLYQPVQALVKAGGQRVIVVVHPSADGQSAKILVRPGRAAKLALHLRVPGWCRSMGVDGAKVERGADGRIVLERRWDSKSTVTVQLPHTVIYRLDDSPSVARTADRDGVPTVPASLFWGPYLLARPAGDDDPAQLPAVELKSATADAATRTVTFPGGVTLRPAADVAEGGKGFRVRVKMN